MSGVRYFQRDDGAVLTGANVFDVNRWEASDVYTEVRIVPADAIVVERSELPEVFADKSAVAGPVAVGLGADTSHLRRTAAAHLALAEYLDANPPVDEAQVQALATSLAAEDKSLGRHVGTTSFQYIDIARSLYRAGVRVVTS